MQACPQEFGRYQNQNHGGDNLKRGGEMAIDPMGLIFTKFPSQNLFSINGWCIAGCWFTLAKTCGFKSLLQPSIVLRQSSLDDTTHP
jgi:hypothetical protein